MVFDNLNEYLIVGNTMRRGWVVFAIIAVTISI